MGLVKHKKLSKTEYNGLSEKDEDTLYAVNENGDFSESNMEDSAELYIGDKKIGGGENFYGECNISPNTVEKAVTTTNGNFVLKKGAKVSVKFLQGHTANTMDLNVDGTGAKNVLRDGLFPTPNMIKGYNVYEFVFDGTYWRIIGVDTHTTSNATSSTAGLMSSTDKTKLDSMATGAGYEANLQWGGRNIADGYSPLDASMSSELGANRFNCYPINKVNIEYSRDAGNTWFDYDATDTQKQNLFVESKSSNIQIGGVGATPSINNRVRITIDTDNTLYARLRKFVIYITNNSRAFDNAWVTITARTQQNYEDNIDTWVTFTDKANIHGWSGWSGWNVINTDVLVTYGNQKASQYGEIRFTFGIDELKSSSNIGLLVLKLMAFGQAYSAPNDLAMYDKPYRYNYDGSMVLPNITPKKEGLNIGSSANKWNEVHASSFYGNLKGNADTASKLNKSLTITNGANSVVFDGSEDKVIDIQSLNEGNSIPKFSRIERNEISTDMIVEGSTPLVGEIIYLDNSHPLSDGFYWYAKDGKYYKWWASANLFKNESTFVTSPNKIFECGEDGQQYVFVPTSYNDDGTAIYGQLLKLTDTKMLDVTYIDLKNLVDNKKLIKGMLYRITDFVTTCNNSGSVSGVNTSSANHPFDIIVTADDNGTLNANARVCLHEGDTYFANNKLSEWVIKYDIKNDTDKYQWADTINGKGVIYYMCDEFGNEAPYDFKNILFGNYYTFSLRMTAITDLSLEGKYCYENKIKGNYEGEKLILNHIRMINTTQNTVAKNILGVNCTNIHLTGTCYDNSLSNSCRDITLPTCSNISFASNCVFISMSTGMRNVCVKNGVQGSSSEPLAISALTGDYVTTVAKNSAGVIKIYNEADLVP